MDKTFCACYMYNRSGEQLHFGSYSRIHTAITYLQHNIKYVNKKLKENISVWGKKNKPKKKKLIQLTFSNVLEFLYALY